MMLWKFLVAIVDSDVENRPNVVTAIANRSCAPRVKPIAHFAYD
ncbi:hypothetical protein [Vibrio vulnificus YJ016]|uniref:Uncharacterized protein n=1 Tax=Vibrio vulnificus (strain YJ016) TaxID=196600 RepID=Q7MF36_VIBVY|nr:hypothetical protein [Vibrio vulnificus YJ016]